jgi:ligand-binding sensor domain-containing protein
MLVSIATNGQTDIDFKFKTYTVNEGLVHNKVNKTVMDAQGFLWIATEGGLSRFDGVTFTNFKNELPFSDKTGACGCAVQKDCLLSMFLPSKFKFLLILWPMTSF